MKPLTPERVFITAEVEDSPDAAQRTERMLTAMSPGAVERVTEAELNEIAAQRWSSFPRWGEIEEPRDPDVVFTTGRFHSDAEAAARRERFPHLAMRDLYGYHHFWFRPDGAAEFKRRTKGILCQSAWQLHTINGCPFRCHYCPFGGLIRVLTNIDEIRERMDEFVQRSPSQRIYKWDNQTDVNCFEPEYGASEDLVEYFAGKDGKYLEIYTGKSDNVDYLLPLDHKGHTILQWSIGCRTQCEVFEPETASMEDRIEAVRKCQEAGYLVRYRFSPILPVRNWREEFTELIELMFERTAPDVISLCMFGWMGVDDARRCLDFDRLDPEIVAAMEASAPYLDELGYTSGGGRPIPHEPRRVIFQHLIDEIKRVSPTTTVALCLETPEMWAALGPALGQTPGNYVCNCGPMCTPGGRLYEATVGTPPAGAP